MSIKLLNEMTKLSTTWQTSKHFSRGPRSYIIGLVLTSTMNLMVQKTCKKDCSYEKTWETKMSETFSSETISSQFFAISFIEHCLIIVSSKHNAFA